MTLKAIDAHEEHKAAVVRALESALERAKSGEFVSISILAERTGTTEIWTRHTGQPDFITRIGQLETLKAELLAGWLATEDA